jgi:4-hydroxybenzoate polyprenyltransferase
MTGYLERMRLYLAEMFPLGRHLSIAAVTYLATAAFARDVHGIDTSVWSAYLLLGVWSYLTVPLLLRLMDELKDLDIDRALFAERPLPSGRVKESDIRTSIVGVIIIYLGANAVHRLTLLAAVVITAYALLMFKRFFAEQAHQDSLPLTLATHNPIVPLSLSYGFFLFAGEHDLALSDLAWEPVLTFVLMLWMPFLAWEVSRKIRAPEEEDAYVTYTRLLGQRGAVGVVLCVQAIGIAAAAGLCFTLSSHWLIFVLPGVAWLVMFWAGRRFLKMPNRRTSELRPFAEAFLIAMIGSVLISFRAQLI